MTKQVQRRRGTASQHTSFTGADGELSVNTTNKSVHVHDGVTTGGIEAARADLGNVSDASLNTALAGNTLSSLTITSADINGGTIDGTTIGSASPAAITGTAITGTSFVSSGNMTFGDNDKAIFGAGSDLQIYHDGANSYIKENNGTGHLVVNATNLYLRNSANSSDYLSAVDGGAVTLKYNGISTLATNATGIDVTGTVTADGLSVDGSLGGFQVSTGGNQLSMTYNGANYINSIGDGSTLTFRMGSTYKPYLKITAGGDISFYEDTGTTPKFFWDASAEALGIGTAAPTTNLQIGALAGGDRTFQMYSAGATRGVLSTDGTNGIFSIGATNDSTTGVLTFKTGAALTERLRIDASGNLGLGVTPSAWASTFKTLQVGATASLVGFNSEYMWLASNWSADAGVDRYITSAPATIYRQHNGGHAWFTAPSGTAGNAITFTQAMTLDASGNLGVGNNDFNAIVNTNGTGCAVQSAGTFWASRNDVSAVFNRLTSNGDTVLFRRQGVQVGSISVTGSATAYNTSSDYRLKENITPIQGASDIVKAMQPVTYTFKSDGSWHDGFLAHELQELHPRAVTGSKDAMKDEEYEVTPAVLDDDGNVVTEAVMGTRSVPDYQGVDYSKLTPILTAALQEALNKIEALEARIVTLETKP